MNPRSVAVRPLMALMAAAAGFAVGASGLGGCQDPCPDYVAAAPGLFTITAAPDPDLVGGSLSVVAGEASDMVYTIRHVRSADGADIEVVYLDP